MRQQIDTSWFQPEDDPEMIYDEDTWIDNDDDEASGLAYLERALAASNHGVTDVPDVTDVTDALSVSDHHDIAELITNYVQRFIELPGTDELAVFVAWVIHAHSINYQDCSPRLALLSPEPGSGKTRALEVLELLVPNATSMFDSSPAALFRLLGRKDDAGLPTVLFDEIDNALNDRGGSYSALIGILNSGYTRGKFVQRMKEQKGEYVHENFEAFSAIAVAGLHDLPPALASRSIIIKMRPSLNASVVERLRPNRERDSANLLNKQICAWVEQNKDQLGDLVKELPDTLSDRAAQIWEPIIMIGDLLGAEWSNRIRTASVNLSADQTRSDLSEGVRLLADIKRVFGTESKMSTNDLLEQLVSLEDSPWCYEALNLTARSMAEKLSRYGIRPLSIRFGPQTAKGYQRSDFHDAWSRYLRNTVTTGTSVTSVTSRATTQMEITCPNCGNSFAQDGA